MSTGHPVRLVTVTAESEGQRVDNFILKHCRKVPKSLIYRWLRKGDVRVNKKRVKAEYRVATDDLVRIPPVKEANAETPVVSNRWQAQLAQTVLYEDDHVVVLNKPSGLPVHGGTGQNGGLIENLRAMRSDAPFLELVHRLDRETSGCIVIAKSRQTLVALHEQLREHQIKKVYHAIVVGKWPKAVNKVDAPVERHTRSSGERVVSVNDSGKDALTTFQILQKFTKATIVSARLHTGRTHQIRVHTQSVGHSILGDRKYAIKPEEKTLAKLLKVDRLCLHAAELSFTLPDGTKVSVKAPYDEQLQAIIDRLSGEG